MDWDPLSKTKICSESSSKTMLLGLLTGKKQNDEYHQIRDSKIDIHRQYNVQTDRQHTSDRQLDRTKVLEDDTEFQRTGSVTHGGSIDCCCSCCKSMNYRSFTHGGTFGTILFDSGKGRSLINSFDFDRKNKIEDPISGQHRGIYFPLHFGFLRHLNSCTDFLRVSKLNE